MSIRTPSFPSSGSKEFQTRVKQWIEVSGEILSMFQLANAGGVKWFEFFWDFESFSNRVIEQKPMTLVTVFSCHSLPMRGTVDEQFISTAVATIPDGVEWLVVKLAKTNYGCASWFDHQTGSTSAELESELRDCFSDSVAVGFCPNWFEETESVTTAVVPDSDGMIRLGAY